MQYAILCYDREDEVGAWTPQEDAACVGRLRIVQDRWAAEGRLGSVARLMPTSAAVTLRKSREDIVLDGPFAETKEQLLGFYVIECNTLDEAVARARELAAAISSQGCYEIRPLRYYSGEGSSG